MCGYEGEDLRVWALGHAGVAVEGPGAGEVGAKG